MGTADDQAAIFTGEVIGRPVELNARMRAFIDKSSNQFVFTNYKDAEWKTLVSESESFAFTIGKIL